MRPALLQLPDASSHPGEAAVGLGLPFLLQITGGAQGQVRTLVKVVTGFAVMADDFPVTTLDRNSRTSVRNASSSADSSTVEKSTVVTP